MHVKSALTSILKIPASAVILLIKIVYQNGIGPFLPKVCIYEPSCSCYTIEAIEKYGLIKGGLMSAWRILRCHPFAKGGYDPVCDKD